MIRKERWRDERARGAVVAVAPVRIGDEEKERWQKRERGEVERERVLPSKMRVEIWVSG